MSLGRIDTLDVFRGLAAFAVVILHYTQGYRVYYGHVFSEKWDFNYGHLGVHFFFIISGFVIFLTLQHSTSVADFLYKRFSRLYPVFWFCCITTFTVVYFLGLPGREKNISDIPFNLTMIPNIIGHPNIDGAYWSLIPEFFFYLAMALVYSFKKRSLFIIWGLAVMILSWVHNFSYNLLPIAATILLTGWGSFFFSGILFYKLKTKDYNKRWHIHVLLLLAMATSLINLKVAKEQLIVACFYPLFYLFAIGKLNWLRSQPLLFLGKISFPLYLLHQNIGYVIMNYTKSFLSDYPVLFIILPIVMIITASWLIHKYIELPSIKYLRSLKELLLPKPTG